ncbi:hypothetical protein O7626_41000 [Micromonospora sp. WMMD1102]|uniref:PIN-like domain-containing protein n=1 Tax=Micromonospora sp. WMMD1102 TaxID=3016105 RepID=UPI002414FB71|nr:hypothetical protein [Micromonospora sp. WMMD1102]MDG4790737.1 hypothetical protein [Micromonospora sp. WMMD1102]MDG4792184.1 hypothetical protein [Micromonospora sp. WMMD1102]
MSELRLFLDRSIGTKKIARVLRELGLDVETIQDRYGRAASTVPDERWIHDASRDGRILVGADQRIRYNRLERRTICLSSARCFTFPRGDLSAVEMIDRLTRYLPEIERICTETEGPFVYHLTAGAVVAMRLDCADCLP